MPVIEEKYEESPRNVCLSVCLSLRDPSTVY